MFTANLEFHRQTKHIEVQHHFIREKVDSKKIVITYISTNDMVADGLSKAWNPKIFRAFPAIMRLH